MMKTEWKRLLIVLSISFGLTFGSDEYFSIVGQRSVQFGKNYEVFLTSSNTSSPPQQLEIVLMTQKHKKIVDKLTFEIPSESRKITFNLKDQKTIQNYTLTAGITNKNIIKSQNVFVYEGDFSVLIQTSRAVYKAGDKVEFRVLAIDDNTKPYQFDKMSVAVTDANRNVIYRLSNVNMTNGAFEGSLWLSDEPLLGTWGIHVKIDNEKKPTIKNFQVMDYQLPRFGVSLITSPTVSLSDGLIQASVFGSYTHGWFIRFVKGSATVKVQVFKQSLNSLPVHEIERTSKTKRRAIFKFDLVNDLKIDINEDFEEVYVKLSLSFEEDLTKTKMYKEEVVIVKKKINSQLFEIESKPKFKPGIPYKVKVTLRDEEAKLINQTNANVNVIVTNYVRPSNFCDSYATKDIYMGGYTQHLTAKVESGVASFSVASESDSNALNLIFSYGESVKSFTVFRAPSRSWHYLEAELMTEKLQINKLVTINVKGIADTERLSAVVIGRTGIAYSTSFTSSNSDVTTFSFTATPDMVPESSLFVYYHEISGEVIHDRIQLEFKEKLPNSLEIQLPKKEAEPGENVTIMLSSTPHSFVYLSAVDITSRLLSLSYYKEEKKQFESTLKSPRSDFKKPQNPRYPDFIDANAFILTNAEKGSLNCNSSSRFTVSEGVFDLKNNDETDEIATESIRNDFSETWIFESFKTNSHGQYELKRVVPDSISSYLIHGFSMNPSIGLGLSAPQRLSVEKPFFVQVNIPFSVRLGEVAKVEVSIFNFHSNAKPNKVHVTLYNDFDQFEFIKIEKNCTVSEESANKQTQSVDHVELEFGALVTFAIRPKVIGPIIIRVKGESNSGTDHIERELMVQCEGVTHLERKTILVDLRNNKFFSHHFTFDINKTDLVRGSTKAGAVVVGNVMGTVTRQNVPKSKGLPKFISDIFYIEYKNAHNKFSPDLQSLNAKLLSSGYQDLIRNRKDNGSFGNIWFTAFAAKCLGHAKHWIEIDENILKDALNYLSMKQTNANSFREDSEVLESIALTAYTTIAFLENDHYRIDFKTTTDDSIKFLLSNSASIETNYELAITTYAMALKNDPKTDQFLKLMKKTAIIEDNHWHWNLEMNKTRKDSATTLPVQIEISSYALLAYLKAGKTERALPILKWLISNSDTKRISLYARDTAIVFQALAEASKVFHSDNFKLDLALIDSRDVSTVNRIDENVNEKEIELASYTDSVSIMANGTGLATLEVWLKYNTKIVDISNRFIINVQAENMIDNQMNLRICTKFLKNENKSQSDLAVMEVTFPSGYEFDPDSKTTLEEANVKKFETREMKTVVEIYLENVNSNDVCLSVKAIQTNHVEGLKAAPIKVYDFYHPDQRGVIFYSSVAENQC